MDSPITIIVLQLVNTTSFWSYKKQIGLRCFGLVNFINAKKFTISSPPLVSLARAEAFQPKNQAYKAVDT